VDTASCCKSILSQTGMMLCMKVGTPEFPCAILIHGEADACTSYREQWRNRAANTFTAKRIRMDDAWRSLFWCHSEGKLHTCWSMEEAQGLYCCSIVPAMLSSMSCAEKIGREAEGAMFTVRSRHCLVAPVIGRETHYRNNPCTFRTPLTIFSMRDSIGLYPL
jgi:hypothetical protein